MKRLSIVVLCQATHDLSRGLPIHKSDITVLTVKMSVFGFMTTQLKLWVIPMFLLRITHSFNCEDKKFKTIHVTPRGFRSGLIYKIKEFKSSLFHLLTFQYQ